MPRRRRAEGTRVVGREQQESVYTRCHTPQPHTACTAAELNLQRGAIPHARLCCVAPDSAAAAALFYSQSLSNSQSVRIELTRISGIFSAAHRVSHVACLSLSIVYLCVGFRLPPLFSNLMNNRGKPAGRKQ